MTGAQRRSAPVAFSASPMITSTVCQSADRRGHRRGAFRHILQRVEDDGHDRDRDQHDHRPRHGRSQNAPQQGEPRGERELKQRRDDHQGCQHRRPSHGERADGHRDERSRRAHQQHVAGADPAHADRLHHGGDAADRHRREHRPGEVRVASPGGTDHDGRRQHHAAHAENGQLQAQTERKQFRRLVVRLVANARALSGCFVLHAVSLPAPSAARATRRGRLRPPMVTGQTRMGITVVAFCNS